MVLSVTQKRIPYKENIFAHINNTCKKAYSLLGFLRRNFRNCPRKVKTNLYSTYVKPILEYVVTVSAPYTRCSIDKLESVQRYAASFVMSDLSD